MTFYIAETFNDSLGKLARNEQTAAKTTAYDMQIDMARPSLKLHRLEAIADRNFWSARVNDGMRIILYRKDEDVVLLYVDQHDAAYRWAEKRRMEVHFKTGAMQLVKVQEVLREVARPVTTAKPLLAKFSDDQLLQCGVPQDSLAVVRQVTSEDELLEVCQQLPHEVFDLLTELLAGNKPRALTPEMQVANPLDHPDAQRTFRVMKNREELELALEYPWERWTTFLHPDQRRMVEHNYKGPVRVAGSAGTGKTIVALHRAVYLARQNPEARVLLTTFSAVLANALRHRLRILIASEPRLAERIEVEPLNRVGVQLYSRRFGSPKLAYTDDVQQSLARARARQDVLGQLLSPSLLLSEWEDVVDAFQYTSWEDYRDAQRLGKKLRLRESQRQQLWDIFALMRQDLREQGKLTHAEVFTRLANLYTQGEHPPYDFVVVDEAQDLSVPQLRFLAAVAGHKPSGLFFAGDLGQRIFGAPFSWKSLGVDVRGRSRTLRVNYRTSHQIRQRADILLGQAISDLDGNEQQRKGTISVFNGPLPEVKLFPNVSAEVTAVASWLKARIHEGMKPEELAVFVRTQGQMGRAEAAVKAAGLVATQLSESMEALSGQAVKLAPMHSAKGLEFRAVAVMAADEDVLPLQERIESIPSASRNDFNDIFDTERHLLYVAMTRARDRLWVSALEPGSVYLMDLL